MTSYKSTVISLEFELVSLASRWGKNTDQHYSSEDSL